MPACPPPSCRRSWAHLTKAPPDLGLDGRIHLLFIDRHGDEFVQNGGDALALGVVVVLAEANQVEQPGRHVLQTEMLQLDTCNRDTAGLTVEENELFIFTNRSSGHFECT